MRHLEMNQSNINMASCKTWTNILCKECGRHVEILNGDFEFSMNLHKQSHKSLEQVNKDFDHSQEKLDYSSGVTMKLYNDCKKYIEVTNDDTVICNNAQTHKPESTDSISDHSASSNNKGRSQNKLKTKIETPETPVLPSALESIFQSMSLGLKAHRDFISEKGCSKATCNLCDITIEPITSVTEHLKTKLHEDNTISVVKTLIPSELQNQMEFISFYGSNLYCNLCGFKVDLCSNNLYETVVNIFVHNAGKSHMSKKSNNSLSIESDTPLILLKTLALIDPAVNENQNLIECKMEPCYKCKPCNKTISFSDKEKELLNNFKMHFNSPDHKKSIDCDPASTLIKKWNDLNIPGKENHSFVAVKQNIYCSACSCIIGIDLNQLLAHVNNNYDFLGVNNPASVPRKHSLNQSSSEIYDKFDCFCLDCSKTEAVQKAVVKPGKEQPPLASTSTVSNKVDVKAHYNELLTSNSTIRMNARYIENEGDAFKCRLCEKVMMQSSSQLKELENILKSHFSGKKHYQQMTKEFNSMLDRVQIINTHIKSNRKFLKKEDGKVLCTLCECIMPSANVEDTLIKHILTHLEGSSHNKKIKMVKEEDSATHAAHYNELLKSNAVVKPEKEQQPLASTNTVSNKVDVKTHYNELLKSNSTIRVNARYIENEGDGYKCKLCGKVMIQSSSQLKELENILKSHFSGKMHKQQITKEFNGMLDKMQITNTHLQSNRKFLRKKDEKVLCTLCNCIMPLADAEDTLIKYIITHLEGTSHNNKIKMAEEEDNTTFSAHDNELLKSHAGVKPGKEQPPLASTNGISNKVDVKAHYNELLKSNQKIKVNARYIENEGDGYKCKLCGKVMIQSSSQLKELENILKSHFSGKVHKQHITKEFNGMLDRMQITNTHIQSNRNFLKKEDEKINCTLCECTMPSVDDEDTLIKNISTHLEGTMHSEKIKMAEVKDITNISLRLEETSHNKKIQTAEVEDSATVNIYSPAALETKLNFIKEVIDKLPIDYVKDFVEFMSVGGISHGYLMCRLCDSTFHFSVLIQHLEDVQHLQRKVQTKGIAANH